MKTAQLFAETLRAHGVKKIFGVVGGHIYPIIHESNKIGIDYIGTRNEMCAGFMAEGWALSTGEFGVCIGTAGPGFTNYLTSVANAERGCIPVLYIGGKSKISEFDTNALQDFNQIDMVKPVAKYAKTILDPKRVHEYLERAISSCRLGKPGPAYIEVPKDVLDTEIDKLPKIKTIKLRNNTPGNFEDIKIAAEILNQAKRPLIIAGSGVWWSQAHKELMELVERTGIPVFTRNAARGVIPDNHPLSLGIAASKSPVFLHAIQTADVALILGTRPGFTMNPESIPDSLKLIRVDIDPSELTNLLKPEVGIHGDIKEVLKQLTPLVKRKDLNSWIEEIRAVQRKVVEEIFKQISTGTRGIHPAMVCMLLRQRIDENTIVVIDGGDAALWGNLILPATGPGQFLSIAGTSFGPLGVGVPYAISAKLANPNKEVILLTGDGAFGYGIMEVLTAIRLGLKLTIVVLNDCHWGMIMRNVKKEGVIAPTESVVGVELGEIKYDELVRAMNGEGCCVRDLSELTGALDAAKEYSKTVCINVFVDPNVHFLELTGGDNFE